MIHQYKLNGYNIVIDAFSGVIFTVDDLSYDVIGLYENTPKDEIVKLMLEKYKDDKTIDKQEVEDVIASVEELKNDGSLFTEDTFSQMAIDVKARKNVIKALCLHVAHTCNLNCEYCFASQGKYHGERAIMSFEVGKRAIDFLIEHSGTRRNLEVDFFGGEPLLNFEVVKQIVKYARSIEKQHNKNFRFTLTTNGMNINDDVIDFCNKEMHNVVLSLDGRKEVHDRLRKTIGGVGSYDIIVPKFQELVRRRGDKEYYMRGTFTHNNVDFTNDIFHMYDLGFRELSMEPVVCAPNDPYALTEEDLPKIYEQYEILAKKMIEKDKAGDPMTFYHYMIDLEHGPCIYKRLSGCGSGTEYLAVTPWGDLYPCHQFVGEEKFCLGNIFDGIKNQKIVDDFKECNVYSRPDCKDCWAKLWCSGGCTANSYHATGDIKGTYEYGCRLFKKRLECAIMMQIALNKLHNNGKQTISSCEECTNHCEDEEKK